MIWPWQRKRAAVAPQVTARAAAVTLTFSVPGATVEVVGESFYQSHLRSIFGPAKRDWSYMNCSAELVLENDNPHDANAVRVDINGGAVGHLSRADAVKFRARYAPYNRNGFRQSWTAEIRAKKRTTSNPVAGEHGVWLDLEL
jgi:hypothetical protein